MKYFTWNFCNLKICVCITIESLKKILVLLVHTSPSSHCKMNSLTARPHDHGMPWSYHICINRSCQTSRTLEWTLKCTAWGMTSCGIRALSFKTGDLLWTNSYFFPISPVDKLHGSGSQQIKVEGTPLTSASVDPLGEFVFSNPITP